MAASADDSGHPDMTPMLDLVMQLLMYFILCANFLGQEVSEELVKLPESAAAVPLSKRDEDILFVNVTANKDNPIVLFGKPAMKLDGFEYEIANKIGPTAPKDGTGRILTTVILRIDGGADYGDVYNVLNICKKNKFQRFNTRLTIKS
jgi:biopolymer transport protein ExbD